METQDQQYRGLFRCLWCRRRNEIEVDNEVNNDNTNMDESELDDHDDDDDDNEDNDSSEDSAMHMIRRRREDRQQQQELQRDAYLTNILITKTIVDTTSLRLGDTAEVAVHSDQFDLNQSGDDMDTCCAICLIDYEVDDLISFSHNPSCQHHFHRGCISSWLKNHDACPCCRKNYLAFSDEEEEEKETDAAIGDHRRGSTSATQTTDVSHSILGVNDPEDGGNISQLDRLYETGALQTEEPSISLGYYEESEPWERRLERRVERLRRQVEDQVQTARQQIREQRANHQRSRLSSNHERYSDGDGNNDEGRMERSIELLRSQLSRVRVAANHEIQHRRTRNHEYASSNRRGDPETFANRRRGEGRWEDAFQVVRTRLLDVANSDSAHRLRERSTRTMQNVMKHASSSQRR